MGRLKRVMFQRLLILSVVIQRRLFFLNCLHFLCIELGRNFNRYRYTLGLFHNWNVSHSSVGLGLFLRSSRSSFMFVMLFRFLVLLISFTFL
jgi:hypothetical protein